MMSQYLCRCAMYLVHVLLVLMYMEGFTVVLSPIILQKYILKPFCKMI